MKLRNKWFASVATLAALAPATAYAQDASESGDDGESTNVIIVTARPGGSEQSKQDAAFAISTIDSSAIDQIAPSSTADLLSVVPGVWAESSGGQNGANIFVRGFPGGGDAEFVTFQYEGSPSFPPPTLSFLENSQLFRLDETIERVEAVRGGPAQVFSNGQVGLTANLITRKGGSEFEGLVKTSITDYGDKRFDAVISGPLGPDTGFMVGGFYHSGDGVRDAGFTAEEGGQISANITHDFGKGNITVWGRYLNDRGAWLLPIPVIQNQDGSLEGFPGFDRGEGTFNSPETRLTIPNDGVAIDQSQGRGANLVNFGANLDYELSDTISLFSKTSYLNGSADTRGLVPAGAPTTVADIAAGFGAGVGSVTYLNGGEAFDPANAVIEVGAWRVDKDLESFVTENGLTFDFGSNTLTAGVYYASFSSRDRWNLGNFLLLEAVSNPRILSLTLDDGRAVTRNGFTRGSFFNVNADYDGEDVAAYISDEWQVTDKLRVDAGIRWHRHEVNGILENNDFGVDTDGDPDTLYNNGDAVLNGTFSTISYTKEKAAWTIGANYAFTDDVGAFLRYSRGNSFPQFDQLRDGLRLVQEIDTYEGGLKVTKDTFSVFATVFYNEFSGIQNTQIVNGAPIPNVGSADAFGVEIEGELRPIDGLSLGGNVTYLDAKYTDFFALDGTVDISGNRLQRQPEWQARGRAAYTASFGSVDATLFGSVQWVDDRFSDNLNTQVLPSYTKVDAGIAFDVNQQLTLTATADNLLDSHGLTEGNPRAIGSQGVGPILARPILGRSFTFSAQFKF
ncbi:TonB-dependent receptor [Erythrobacter mangrovi]|uniref:TonB-dependent receptor n=1 Tax=Erythrobacter mangrovi TaxID=2739433 RepID=A0A7D4CEM7_9SPHN|nr:TonB-dependent receptor [Erythrobacter mangrovi]QKG72589.1 TonB-dependent receptor [Erythrobacter mangrovi]